MLAFSPFRVPWHSFKSHAISGDLIGTACGRGTATAESLGGQGQLDRVDGMKSIRDQLESLYDQCGDQFYRCALAVTRCPAAAEDAVHNAIRSAFRLKATPDNLRAYLFRSIRNAAIDLIRKDSRLEPLSAEMIFEIPAKQTNTVHHQEFLEDFTKELDELSSDERETIVQHLVVHLSFQEISDLRGRPMGTVTSWYRRGLKKLKQKLEHEYGTL
jgi:RNA polymerase sigma factor (sigma-70 family)